MEKTVAAIDVGYGYTKSAIGTSRKAFKCNIFPSQAPVANNLAMAEALGSSLRIVQIPIQGLLYAVGPDVSMATGAAAVRNTDNTYSESDEYLALVRGAFHYMKVDKIDLLVAGLPVKIFEAKREALERRLIGTHDVGDGRTVAVKRVRILAQPRGALMTYAIAHDQVANIKHQTNLIPDPGSRTFDWVLTKGLKPFTERSGSVDKGMLDVLRLIAEGISRDERVEFSDYERIDKALRTGTSPLLFGKEYDLRKYLAAARKITQEAVTAMKRAVGDGAHIDNIILGNGGAFFFRQAIQEGFPRHKVHELREGIYANAIGFLLAGIELVLRENRQADPEPGLVAVAGN